MTNDRATVFLPDFIDNEIGDQMSVKVMLMVMDMLMKQMFVPRNI